MTRPHRVRILAYEGCQILDVTGKEVGKLELKAKKGLQALQWDARIGNQLAQPGSYAARMTFGDKTMTQMFTLHADPKTSADADGAATSPNGDRE